MLSQALLAVSQVAFPLLTYPVVTRALGAGGLGQINFIDSLAQFLVIVAGLGIPLYGIREMATAPVEKRSKTFSELFILQLLLLLPVLGVLFAAGRYANVETSLLWIAAANVVVSGLSSEWCLQGLEAFGLIALRSFFIRLVGFAFIYFLINDRGDAVLYYLILVGSVAATFLFNMFSITRVVPLRVKEIAVVQHLKKIGWLYFCYLLIAAFTLLDNFWLGLLASKEAVGYYSFGYKLIRMSSLFIASLGVVFIPRIAVRWSQANNASLAEQVRISQQLVYFLAMPMGIFFFMAAPELVQVLARADFRPSVDVIRILSVIPLVVGMSHLTGMQLLVPLQKERFLFFVLLGAAVTSTALNFLLIPHWQQKAAAFSNVVTESMVTGITGLYLYRKKILCFDLKSLLLSAVFSLSLLPVLWVIRLPGLPPLVVLLSAALGFAVVYLLLHWTLASGSIVQKIFQFKLPA